MENTIENATEWFKNLFPKDSSISAYAAIHYGEIIHKYAEQITAEKDRTISDLRRQLSDCKAKVRIGVNTDRT